MSMGLQMKEVSPRSASLQHQDWMIKIREASLADRDKLAFRRHGFHEAAFRTSTEWGDAEIAAVADLSRGECVHQLSRKLRK